MRGERRHLQSSHLSPAVLEILLILTMGVLPILYRTFGIISIFSFLDIKIFDQLWLRGSSCTHGLSMEWGPWVIVLRSCLVSLGLQVHLEVRSGLTKPMGQPWLSCRPMPAFLCWPFSVMGPTGGCWPVCTGDMMAAAVLSLDIWNSTESWVRFDCGSSYRVPVYISESSGLCDVDIDTVTALESNLWEHIVSVTS